MEDHITSERTEETAPLLSFPTQLPPRHFYLKNPDLSHKRLTSHFHIDLQISDLEETELPEWHFLHWRHKASDLANLVDTFSRRMPSTMAPWQKKAWQNYATQLSLAEQRYGLDHGSAEDIDVINTYFQLFDELFFFKGLKRNTTIELVETLPNAHHARCYDKHTFSDAGNGSDEPSGYRAKCVCVVKIKKSTKKSRRERLTFYLGLLLHEMCHAFLAIYACRSRRCHMKREHAGRDGHGEAWGDIALAVEESVEKTLGLKLDLDRMLSYAWELMVSSASPSDKIRSWGMSRRELSVERRRLSEDAGAHVVDGGPKRKNWYGAITPVLIIAGVIVLATVA